MKLNMEIEGLKNYVTISRDIMSHCRNGIISIPERNLLTYLRLEANPYGITHCDLGSIAREAFNTPVDKSYINRLMLSLKSKKYIWYQERKGRRGSFEVHHDNWIRPDKSIKHLFDLNQNKSNRGATDPELSKRAEARPVLDEMSQRFSEHKPVLTKERKASIEKVLRGRDTDTDKDINFKSNNSKGEDRVGGTS